MRKHYFTLFILTVLVCLAIVAVAGTNKADAAQVDCGKTCGTHFARFDVVNNCDGVFVKTARGIQSIKYRTPTPKKHIWVVHSKKGFEFSDGSRWLRVVAVEKSCA